MQNLARIWGTALWLLFMAFVGFMCLFRTGAVRDYALRTASKKIGPYRNPYLKWMQTSQYVWSLRLIGILAVAAFFLVIFLILRSLI